MKMTDVTAMGRVLDPSYPTNRVIVVLTLVGAIVGGSWCLLAGDTFLASALWGIGAAIVLLLTWMLSRELDPDHGLSAFVAVGPVAVALVLFGLPSLLAAFWLLLMLRLLIRSVGPPARPLDTVVVLGLGLFLTWQGHWLAGLMTAVVFLFDGLLDAPLRYHLLVSALALVTTAVLALVQGSPGMATGPTTPVLVVSAVTSVLFLVTVLTSRPVRAVGDETGEPLSPVRVQTAQALTLLSALLFAWWAGQAGLVALSPIWAAMTGIGLYRIGALLLNRGRGPRQSESP